VITVEKNAAYPNALRDLKAAGAVPASCELRRKGQMQGVNKGDSPCQARFIAELFGVAIETQERNETFVTILFL
jgi:hypothetical protein